MRLPDELKHLICVHCSPKTRNKLSSNGFSELVNRIYTRDYKEKIYEKSNYTYKKRKFFTRSSLADSVKRILYDIWLYTIFPHMQNSTIIILAECKTCVYGFLHGILYINILDDIHLSLSLVIEIEHGMINIPVSIEHTQNKLCVCIYKYNEPQTFCGYLNFGIPMVITETYSEGTIAASSFTFQTLIHKSFIYQNPNSYYVEIQNYEHPVYHIGTYDSMRNHIGMILSS